ncbi:MAG: MotA/TolQ/ExbB proton channel family protein [Pseudomonadota bacterium]|nr:MotA/TolQ/ExbB proton channel family protein [Pseudomonadota bacterium]
MVHGMALGILHHLVSWLLYPVLAALAVCLLAVLWETGAALGEKFGALQRLQGRGVEGFERYALGRLERVDLLARCGPILGLMGTLIPLGPGLSALGSGDIEILATAMTVAFDTTVLGLLIGLVGYGLGRVRRRWYETCLQQLEQGRHYG